MVFITSIAVIVACLSALVMFLIGWQVHKTIEAKNIATVTNGKIDELEKRINKLDNRLSVLEVPSRSIFESIGVGQEPPFSTSKKSKNNPKPLAKMKR